MKKATTGVIKQIYQNNYNKEHAMYVCQLAFMLLTSCLFLRTKHHITRALPHKTSQRKKTNRQYVTVREEKYMENKRIIDSIKPLLTSY
jgi:hypothetical protein